MLALVCLVAGLAGCGDAGPGAPVVRFQLHSRLLHRTLEEVAVVPPGPRRRRPLLVLLHGRGMGPDGLASSELYAALKRLGRRAPVVLLANGGDHSYFHDRRDGAWGSYVLREAIPRAAARLGADPRRVAIGGVSMGGFGALDLARLAPGRFCAVGAHSAALWSAGGKTPAGAFDDAGDFARHDVLGAARRRPGLYRRTRVWIDVGTDDPFRRADTALARLLPQARFHVWPGKHESAYWNRHIGDYLRFYSAALEAC